MTKTVFVPAYGIPLYKNKEVKEKVGTEKGFLGNKDVFEKKTVQEPTGKRCDRRVDGERLAEDINAASAELESAGYEVIDVSMVTSGDYDWKYELKPQANGGYGYGYGYSYTQGALLLAKKTSE